EDPPESFRHRLADRQQPMIAENHRDAVAHVADQPFPLIKIERNALIAMIGKTAVEHHRMLAERKQAMLLRRNGHARRRMRMQDAVDVMAGAVDGAVNGVAGGIDLERRVVKNIPVDIDLHEAGGGDLVEEQSIGVDQKVILGSGDPRGNMREDQIAHAQVGNELIAGRQIDPRLPFFVADLAFQAGYQFVYTHLSRLFALFYEFSMLRAITNC